MDPITASIVGALTTGALQGLGEIGKTAITDGYKRLKNLLYRKFGARSNVAQALTQLEAKPTSSHRQGVLHEELTAVNAARDPDLVAAARQLQMIVQQQQSINLHGSPVQGSIVGHDQYHYQYQVGRDQYQVGRDQYNIQASNLVGPRAGRTARNVFGIVLIVLGFMMVIPAIGAIPFFDSLIHAMIQSTPGSDASDLTLASSFGTTAHVILYLMIGVGIFMVIMGVALRMGRSKN